MADDTFKPFEDAKSEIFKKVPDGSVPDDDKFADLKKAYEDAHGDLSKLNIYAFIKPVENTPEPNKDPSKINEESTSAPAPENEKWKEETLKKWQEWADKNNKLLSTYEDPDNKDNLSFKIYANEDAKKNDTFEADFSYSSPRDVTLKGKDGKIPDQKYFDELVAKLKAENGPDIEFGNIKSNEFKAKLLAACLKDPEIKITNAPSEKDIASWDKSLQDIVKVKPQNDPDNKDEQKISAFDTAKNIVRETLKNGKKEIDIEKLKPEEKALYLAATMDIVNEMNQGKKEGDKDFLPRDQITFKGGLKYDEAVEAAKKLPKEEQNAAKAGLKSYTIMSMKKIAGERTAKRERNKDKDGKPITTPDLESWQKIDAKTENLTTDQIILRNLRMGVRNKDAEAQKTMYKRRNNTLTDEYKYQQEPELDEKGNQKVDDKGKPIYQKDKDGKPVFKKDKDGKNIESSAYIKFKENYSKYNKTK